MFSRLLLLSLVYSLYAADEKPSLLIAPAPTSKCPANSAYTTCSSMCEPKCGAQVEMMCIEMCGPAKCQCNPGFLRDVDGSCVAPEKCSTNLVQKCPANQTFTTCSSHCEPICGQDEPIACILSCGPPKCQCNVGFFRNAAGDCVKKADCGLSNVKKCSTNEEWDGCGALCEPKCGQDGPMICPAICMTKGACRCKSGFFRDPNGKCVSKGQCPANDVKCTAKCKEGMKCVLQEVQCIRAPCNPIPTCVPIDPPCTAKCKPGQKCVLKEVICVRAPCNPIPTCVDDTDIVPSGCAAVSCMVGQRCVVDERTGMGKCVEGTAQGNCSKNEHWDPCASCEAKCGDKVPLICTKICNIPGACRCDEGFFRDPNGRCVTQNECESFEPPKLTCANVLCAPGSIKCIETPEGPRCISNNQTCGKNEYWNGCGGCEANCGDTGPVICPLICRLEGACRCKEGFYRSPNGECVTKKQCDVPRLSCANVDCMPGNECVMAQQICKPGQTCPQTPTCIPSNASSCKNVRCAGGTKCIMVQVQCFTTPCYPQPQCVPDVDVQPTRPPVGPTCALILCREGTMCVETPQGAQCLENELEPPTATCEVTDCKSGFECVMSQPPCSVGDSSCPQTPTCIPQDAISCKTAKCTKDTICAMIQVQCFAEPCYPVPECIPIKKDPPVGPCATIRCRAGYKCIEETLACIRAPCPGQGTHGRCVPIVNTEPELTCANTRCANGWMCHMVEGTCIDAPCPPTPQCVDPNVTQVCPENEIHTECAPNCEETCHGVQSCKAGMAIEMCRPGCKCAEKHRRNGKGKCVKNRVCYLNPGCKENEEWHKCIGCEKKCGQTTDQACDSDCRSGCACSDGFARNADGNCVSEDKC